MVDFFSSLISYIEIIWDFFLNFINSFLTFVTTLVGAVALPPMITPVMWAPISASILAVAGFAVVKIVLGRSNV